MEFRPKQNLIPRLKKVELDLGSSLLYSRYTEAKPDAKAYWHYHPEVELVYTKHGFGNRFVGNHISRFDDGDLVLMGPNLPHFGYEFGLQGINEEIVVQFGKELFEGTAGLMPELESIQNLIVKAQGGIAFFGETKEWVGEQLELMEKKNPFDRLMIMLQVLQYLSQAEEYEVLNAEGVTLIIQNQDDDRINKVYNYVKENYETEISLDQISKVALMTVPAFCRFFKKSTKKTFTNFVNEFRIRQSIRLLATENRSIGEVASEVGFNNISHFNKQFKRVTGASPSQYKKTMEQIIS